MVIGSHNSWSYLKPKCWLLRPFAFMARCQEVDIKTQYEKYNVRCFDLRIKFDKNGLPEVRHGFMTYKITSKQLSKDLDYINSKGDCYVRILLEVRSKCQYTIEQIELFKEYCQRISWQYQDIKFWCGRNLYNWDVVCDFGFEPSCEEKYASVCPPKLIDDWYPKLYAERKNKENIQEGTDKDILLIDFVDIQ